MVNVVIPFWNVRDHSNDEPFLICTFKNSVFESSMSVFASLLVVFYKNVFVFLGIGVFVQNVLSYFMKMYVNVSTPKYASISFFLMLPYSVILFFIHEE